MTKEEFEKEFKVGDGITLSNWSPDDICTLVFIGKGIILIENSNGLEHTYSLGSDWQKVEPVKRYWKHVCRPNHGGSFQVFISEDGEKDSEYNYLKEPTEINLDEI